MIRPLTLGVFLFCGLVLSGVASGQESPKAVLVDEHGLLPCDDSIGRLDVFYAELAKNPPATGLIVISANPEEKVRAVFRERLIRSYTAYRKMDAERFSIVRARSDGELKFQMWLIPPGTERFEVHDTDMTYSLSSPTKPFNLAADYPDVDDGICPPSGEFTNFNIFARFLKDNPEARGNLVVKESTLRIADAKGKKLLRELQRGYGIERRRLRLFTGTRRNNASDIPIVEYWFLP